MDEHTLNDLLECSVCLERLDTSSKVLPCQHTFCRKCLEVIVASRQELRCPECRVLVAIKIDELPPNVLLMRILEGIKNAAAAKAQTITDNIGTTTATTTSPNDKLQQQQQHQKHLNEEQQKQFQQLKLKQQQQQQKQMLQYQQQQQQQLGNTINNTITVTTTPPTSSSSHQLHQQQSQQQQQQRRCMVPHAYALYDFNSNETNDLHFKKGDLILLKRKMDSNWYIGQLNGKEGTFPINYVQVIVPLPMPQCIALYDFKMGPNEEEGCLSFKKGTLIHVLRRVDHNWAEGRIGTTIGIFPIAFVELNPLAKQLLETCSMPSQQQQQQQQQHQTQTIQQQTVQQQQQATRNLPPIPLLESVNTMNNSNSGGECQTTTSSSSTTAAAATTTSSSSTSSSTASSQATSPSTATTTNNTSSSGSSSTRNSPTSALATPTNISSGTSSVRYRGERKEKRHSLNALLIAGAATSTGNAAGNIGGGGGGMGTLNLLQAHRHSAEILSMPHELCENTNNVRPRSSGPPLNNETSTMLLSANNSPPTIPAASPSASSSSHARINVLKMTGGNSHLVPPTLPWGYLALYPYKPRKSDELELKKGCVYIVTEHCLDGWFKGKNWQDISGVFPGNYVTPLRMRDQQQLMHQWKFVPPPPPQSSSSSSNHAATHSPTNQLLPELPPRQQQITSAAVAPPPLAPPTPTPTCTAAVWTKPLSHTVEAFFNRHKNTTATTTPTTNNTKVENKEQEHKKDSNNVGSSSSSSSSTSAAVNLMKRLAHIKSRSKSPSQTATQSQQQQQNNLAAVEERNPGHLHAVHVRSGSCPSQLLQNLSPMDLHNSSTAVQTISSSQQQQQQQQQHKQSPTIQMTNNVNYAGSQRIKGHKERIQLCTQNTTRTNANNNNNNNTNNDAIYNNLQLTVPTTTTASTQALQTKCAQQQQQQQQCNGDGNTMIHHRKSQSLDANSTLAATQTATTLNTATATATTTGITNINKCPRDGRFRCVVPYPPNSDIELELHVGDIIYVQRKQKNGWYKGIHTRTHKMGLFPASFVEPDI